MFLEMETYLGTKLDLLFATRENCDRLIFLSTSFLFCKMEITVSNSQEELTSPSDLTTSSWNGFSLLAYVHDVLCAVLSHSIMSNSLQPHGKAPLSMGILQARILEWVVIPFSRGSFQPRDRTWVSCIAGRFFTV